MKMQAQATRQTSHSYTHKRTILPTQLQNRTRRLATIVAAILAATATASAAWAESSIDPVAQVYFVSEVDHAGPLTLRRIYSSASTFRGHFGVGWCSELDARIRIYEAREIRYRGCDIETGSTLDARRSTEKIHKENFGFRRTREDGATQIFNRDGYLAKVIRLDFAFEILRDDLKRPRELLIRSSPNGQSQRLSVSVAEGGFTEDAELALITSIGSSTYFQYKDASLIRSAASRFSYNDDLNMTMRTSGAVSETIEYDPSEDRVTRIMRSPAFGRDRLLLAMVRRGKSNEGEIEMKIEVERGAEMRPVRILYNRETRSLSLEGDREVARMILNWMRT